VPIICLTLHNAPRNAQLVQHRGIGVGLEKKDILQGKLANAIEKVITDPK
jgi:UDP:flavonoid glycosyltransferase YjiC (YdhE family)